MKTEKKYSFKNDYSEAAHPRILKALTETNFEQCAGYGLDIYCEKARALIQSIIQKPDAEIHFLTGGTQTNLIALSSFLRPHEAVIACKTGHISVHETGAIEATGHKVIITEEKEGKIQIPQIQKILEEHNDEHCVKPRIVYISNSTELGTVYTKNDLVALSEFCKKNNLLLYMDGARLGAALSSKDYDLSLKEIANLVDAFYIGGTKNGTLFGEALIIVNKDLQKDFRYLMKQKGGLLAKGRLLGIQFLSLFENNLFFELALHANRLAQKIQKAFLNLGFPLLIKSPTNQIFPILPQSFIEKLSEHYDFFVWEKINENESAIRLITSWATPEEKVDEFIADIKLIAKENQN